MFQVSHYFRMLTGKEKLLQIFQIKFHQKYVGKIKLNLTFNIEKQLIHNFVNGYKHYRHFKCLLG